MAIEDVANSLVQLCKEGKFKEAMEAHYSENIVSIEAMGNEQMPQVLEGIEAVRQKGEWWESNNEVHGLEILGPYYNQNQFSVHMMLDVTPKESGQRVQMNEVCLYDVENDKIVRETFYYNMADMG